MFRLRYLFTFTVIIIAVLVIYPEFKGNYNDIPLLFKEADKSLLIFLVLFQGLNYFGGGWLFQTLSAVAGFRVRLIDTFKIAILGVVGAHIAPFFGSSIITFFSFRKLKIPPEVISFLIPTWSFFIWISYIFFSLIGLLLLPSLSFEFLSFKIIIFISLIVILILITPLVLLRKKGKYLLVILNNLLKIINKFVRLFRGKDLMQSGLLKKFVSSFYQNIGFLRQNKGRVPSILFASLFFYFGDILTLYFSYLVFGFQPNFIVLILGYTLSLILAVLTLIPATPGIMEASLTLVFIRFGWPGHIVLLASLLFRLFTYWLPLPIGIYSYWKLRKTQT